MDKKGLVEGIRDYMARLKEEGRFSTAKSYQDAMNSFIRFSEKVYIPYSYMNRETLRHYENYLEGHDCSRNTISTYMRRLRCIYNMAVEKGEAVYVPYLFRDVYTGIESKRKKSLSIEEQHKLMAAPVNDDRLRQTQLAVCLMYQYGGMAFVDFAHLKVDNIKKGVLDYRRQKTGSPMRMEMLKSAEVMREKLGSMSPCMGRYLFSFLCGLNDGYAEYKEYNNALAKFNRDLKALGKATGVKSDLTSYSIRHSFAMTLKDTGVPIEMISELLGHKSIKTTQIYLRSFSLEKQTAVNYACFENVYNYMRKIG